ncbi:class II aldolase/adducin family protein [Pelagibius sp. CAU 1746]|uniref:class II aldolase/adducin family protein n=1 Tax=Pelagibius sp. CAU 1746 TaxID=3140370 RepID=UPI00325B4D9A
MTREEQNLRQEIIQTCLAMNHQGINQGTSGNVSARHGKTMLITPSGIPYEALKPADIVAMPLDDDYGAYEGKLAPSSEWRFHLDIMAARPEVGAIVHTHSTYATAMAICGFEIPAVHYMIAAAGGPTIRVAPYATYGTKELSRNALQALEGRGACLLANHGVIATGPGLQRALWLAGEVETLARQYVLARSLGKPVVLPEEEIAAVVEKFKSYGPRAEAAPAAPKPAPRRKRASGSKPSVRKRGAPGKGSPGRGGKKS